MIVVNRGLVIDLTQDTPEARRYRERASRLGLWSLLGFALWATLATGIKVFGLIPGAPLAPLTIMPLTGFLFFAALNLYQSDDISKGNASALRGMLVMGVSLAAWLAWGGYRTTSSPSLFLAILGGFAGSLLGAPIGGMIGVVLGWATRRIRSFQSKRVQIVNYDPRGVWDRWLDG